MIRAQRLLLVVAALTVMPATVHGQTVADLLEQAIRSYQNLEFDAASAVLRRVLEPGEGVETDLRIQADALAYLAATDVYRGRPVSAASAFRRLVRLDPRYRPDELVFPPEVTNLFEEIRQQTKATRIEVTDATELRVGFDRLALRVLVSSLHDLSAEIRRLDGSQLRLLYIGPVADSLDLGWDGLDEDGNLASSGEHLLTVESLGTDGQVASVAQVPLHLEVRRAESLTPPPPPAEALFLPERRTSGPGIEALAGGLVLGAAVAALPALVASGSETSGARFAIGGAISLAGVIGYFARRPGEELPANVVANAELRRQWQQRVQDVEEENARRREDIRLWISTVPPQATERSRP